MFIFSFYSMKFYDEVGRLHHYRFLGSFYRMRYTHAKASAVFMILSRYVVIIIIHFERGFLNVMISSGVLFICYFWLFSIRRYSVDI